ncbi:MAG TPA: IgGFc-binding protein, partial [Polyangiaceae bacterium]|nr:IgGFc-binding protein [Polyangiaceae bacterium]
SCSEGIGSSCTEDGTRVETYACDPLQGMRCEPDGCKGACSPSKLGRTHVGCDFWPTITSNTAWSDWFAFGVFVINTTELPAVLTVTRGSEVIATRSLPASGTQTIELPWIRDLKGQDADWEGNVSPSSSSTLSKSNAGAGAYRLRSDQPVVVLQFNTLGAGKDKAAAPGCPIDASSGECLSYSNDASLLLPTSSAGSNHVLMGWRSWPLDSSQGNSRGIGDFASITALHEGTVVAVTPATRLLSLEPSQGQGFEGGITHEYQLDPGDVLQLISDPSIPNAQLSGSVVAANRPIQVLTGVSCANVPIQVPTCDHIEETNLPLEMFGRRYIVTDLFNPAGRPRQMVRIHGLVDDTLVSFDPPSAYQSIRVRRGETVDLDLPKEQSSAREFMVSSTHPIGVTQYMVGNLAEPYQAQAAGINLGDPSQTFVVPVSRYLKRYFLAVPTGFEQHRVDIVASTGSEVYFDGRLISPESFRAVGASGFSVARLEHLEPGKRHEIRGEKALGVQVYGFGPYTSWMAPGGIELRSALP